MWHKSFFHIVSITAISYGWLSAIPIVVPYLNELLGSHSYFFYFVLLSTFAGLISNIFFGRLLDKFNSRIVISIGITLNIAFWITLIYAKTTIGISIAFIFEGLSYAAIAVSVYPYSYDIICSVKDKKSYPEIQAKIRSYMLVFMVILLILSGFLYSLFYAIPYIFNIFICFASLIGIYLSSSISIKPEKIQINKNNFIQDFKKIIKSKELFYLILIDAIYFALSGYLFFIIQSHLVFLNTSVFFLSILTASVYISRAIGSSISKGNKNHILAGFLFFLVGFLLITIGFSSNPYYVFVIFLLTSLIKEFIGLYISIHLMEKSPKKLKGTVKSLSETINNSFIFLYIFSMGYISSNYNPNVNVILFGLLFLFVFFIWVKYYKELPLKSV